MIATAGAAALPIAVVTGLAFEARVAAGLGVVTICGSASAIADRLADVVARGCRGIVSFGIAGGLVAGREARRVHRGAFGRHAKRSPSRTSGVVAAAASTCSGRDARGYRSMSHVPISTADHKRELARTHGRGHRRYGIRSCGASSRRRTDCRSRRCGWWPIHMTAHCRRPRKFRCVTTARQI